VQNAVLEVDRTANETTRVVHQELGELGDGQVRLRIDRFALTANNITYAGVGDLLGYWDFFPSGADGWGRVPAMGWAEVVESRVDSIDVGGRYYGWFPMAGYVDLAATPTSDGLRDDGAHRAAHAPVRRPYRVHTLRRERPTSPVLRDQPADRLTVEPASPRDPSRRHLSERHRRELPALVRLRDRHTRPLTDRRPGHRHLRGSPLPLRPLTL